MTVGIFFLSTFIGLPLIGMLGSLCGLLLLPMIIPGVCTMAGYISWCFAYFGATIPGLLVTCTDFMPQIISFLEANLVPVTKTVSENQMLCFAALPAMVAIPLATMILMNIRFVVIGFPGGKAKMA